MGIICNAGIRFVLGWRELSKDDVAKKLVNICNNLKDDTSERCWNCPTNLPNCIVRDETYGMRLWVDNKTKLIKKKFYNFQLTNSEVHGWMIEYQIDCDNLYTNRIRSENTIVDKSHMVKVAEKASELLGFNDLTLIPYPYADTWRG
jgi:hypothetical protein